MDGLLPGLGPSRLLRYVPEISSLCDVGCEQLYNLDSTNIGPEHWLGMARLIKERYGCYDGFVITHGTDTMAYTAAALSYLIQGSRKPIVLTGAQKPIGFETTDSKRNMLDAFLCACTEAMHGVCVVFNGRVITGTRACKTHSKSFDAFSSINYPNLAAVCDGRLLQYIVPEYRDEPLFFDYLETRVGLVKLTPGMDREMLSFALRRWRAVVVESFGVGGLPRGAGMHELITRADAEHKTVIMTTQVQNEGSDLAVYETGNSLVGAPSVLEAYDMTSEAALAKIMWILGRTSDRDEIREMFYTPVAMDILTKTESPRA